MVTRLHKRSLEWRSVRVLLAMMVAIVTLMGVFALPARAELAQAGPVDPSNGFPYWYEDANGVKLDLCLDPNDQMCLQPFPMPDPTQPVSFPDNFPDEAFWWAGDAQIDRPAGGKALLVMAAEAAFGTPDGSPKAGQQMSFGRIRVRIDGLVAGETYKVTHPYGVEQLTAQPDGTIFYTEDLGCGPGVVTPCDFNQALSGRVGPFLTWDTLGNPDQTLAPPAGYVGDPNVEHKVVGSPLTDAQGNPQNYFKVEGPNVGGQGIDTIQTDQFLVAGKISRLQVSADPKGGSYQNTQDVTLTASDKAAQIYYTTDGTEPTAASTLYTGPVNVSTDTTLKFMAQDAAGNTSAVQTEAYTIDTAAPPAPSVPKLDAASDSGVAGDNLTNDTTPTFVGTAEPGSTVKIFAGGVQKGTAKTDANGNYAVTSTSLASGINSITVTATDGAGNASNPSGALEVTIDTTAPTAPTANPGGGSYAAPQSVSLSSEAGAEIRYTNDGSVPTAQSTLYSGPIQVSSSSTIRAIAFDVAGNKSAVAAFDYVIAAANTAPTITNISPADGSTTRNRKPTISATVRDAQTNLAAANIIFRIDGNPVSTFAYNRTTDLLTYKPPRNLALGQHTVRIVATDAQGLTTPRTWSFTIVR